MNHRALVTFRWLSLATAALATAVTGASAALVVGLAAFAVSNALWSRQPAWSPTLLLALDTIALTGWLAVTGGAMNPLSVYYLVYVVVAALLVDRRTTALVATLSTIGFASLFAIDVPHAHNHTDMRMHLLGMWISYAVAAAVVTLFVARESEAAKLLRASHAKMEKLAQLTTLAAGAAHELGTPLSTIAVIAGDLAANDDPELHADARLISTEVERCRSILLKLRAEPGGEVAVAVTPTQLHADVRAALGSQAERVAFTHDGITLHVPLTSFTQAVTNLTKNALEASPQRRVHVHIEGGAQRVTVDDEGPGIDPLLFARLGEPFFTTKAPGRGLGLGLFLAKTLAEQHGGTLTFANRSPTGARFILTVPSVRRAA